MQWDDLRYLLAVERSGTFAAAAKLLRVDATTVGRRLAALQDEVGARLVIRTTTGCRLTRAGRRACETAAAMEDAARSLEADVSGRDAGIEGTVRITTAAGFVPVLVRAIDELRREHPALSFELLTATTTLNLLKGEADLAIRMTRDSQPSLVSRRLGHIRWGLFASEAYLRRKGTVRTLRGHDVVGYVEPMTRTAGGVWLAAHAEDANVVIRVADAGSAVVVAAEGLGLAAAPTYMAEREPRLSPAIAASLGASECFVVTTREVGRLPRVRATVDKLAEVAKRERVVS